MNGASLLSRACCEKIIVKALKLPGRGGERIFFVQRLPNRTSHANHDTLDARGNGLASQARHKTVPHTGRSLREMWPLIVPNASMHGPPTSSARPRQPRPPALITTGHLPNELEARLLPAMSGVFMASAGISVNRVAGRLKDRIQPRKLSGQEVRIQNGLIKAVRKPGRIGADWCSLDRRRTTCRRCR